MCKEKSIVVQEEKENEESGVFSSKGSIEGCCNEFLEIFCQKSTGNKDNYDSAICVNDMVAAIFLKKASERGVRVPEDLHVSGYGNSTICRFTKPPLTTIDLNYRKAGENAVAIFNMLGMMTGIISLSTVIESRIYVRGSTGCHPVAGHNEKTGETCAAEKLQFINDPDVVELYKIEKILNHCDELDLKIIDGILAGKGKENIAESIPIGVSTFRYRMAKLLAGVGLKSRKELSELLCKYGITNTYI